MLCESLVWRVVSSAAHRLAKKFPPRRASYPIRAPRPIRRSKTTISGFGRCSSGECPPVKGVPIAVFTLRKASLLAVMLLALLVATVFDANTTLADGEADTVSFSAASAAQDGDPLLPDNIEEIGRAHV